MTIMVDQSSTCGHVLTYVFIKSAFPNHIYQSSFKKQNDHCSVFFFVVLITIRNSNIDRYTIREPPIMEELINGRVNDMLGFLRNNGMTNGVESVRTKQHDSHIMSEQNTLKEDSVGSLI